MSRPVFSFRPNLEDPQHQRAWEILKNVPDGRKNNYLVQAILQADDAEYLKRLIRETVREELKGGCVAHPVSDQENEEIPSVMLDFLMGME